MRVCRDCGGDPLPPSAGKGRICGDCDRARNNAYHRYYRGTGEKPPKTAKPRDPDYVRLRGERYRTLYDKGWNCGEIAELFGCSERTVGTSLNAVGTKMRGNRDNRPDRQERQQRFRAEVVRRYMECGESVKQIAADLRVHPQTVCRSLRKEGDERGECLITARRLRRRREAARRYGERDEGICHIAFILDVSPATIWHDLKSEGVEIRGRSEHPWKKQMGKVAGAGGDG